MSESQTKNAVQQMAEKMMPGLRTDHGGINLGDIVVLAVSSVLLIYTGYRSWHFLSVSIPGDFQILALVGLWGIDIAMVAWAVVWIFGSSSPGQDGVSMSMWIVDVVAMVLTSVIDTVMYADGSAIPDIFKTIAWYGVPLIIVGNAVMAVIYHFTSPSTKYRRQQRKLDAALNDARQKGDHEIREITATADLLQEHSMKRANALLSIANVANQNVQMVDLEQSILKKLNQAGMGHLAGPLGVNAQAPSQGDSLEEKIECIRNATGSSGSGGDGDQETPAHKPALTYHDLIKYGANGSGPKAVG